MSSDLEKARQILSPPGDTLQETLDEIGMSQAELAERTGRPKEKVNDIVKGREPISIATAFQLEKVLGIPAGFWLNREQQYRKRLFELDQRDFLEDCLEWYKAFPIKELKKHGALPETRDQHELVLGLLNFFGVASPTQWQRIYIDREVSVAFRVSLANTKSPHAISAWLRLGEIAAKKLPVGQFHKKKFKDSLIEAKKIAYRHPENFANALQDLCAKCGVALVYVPTLTKAPISGATRWFHNTPLIQLSGRHKTDDHFWFTFFHESAHIILHGKKDIFLEDVEGTAVDKEKEEEANLFASKFLLAEDELQEILDTAPLDEEAIISFAEKFSTPAGVIVGQLQHKGLIPFSVANQLKRKIDLFE